MGIGRVIVFFMACASAAAQATDPPAPRPPLTPEVVEALFDPDASTPMRDHAMRQVVTLAQAGNGEAAFYLGALYRHGMDHPARRVDRDEETARFWFEKCVASMDCPLLALASLAELELGAGNAKPAMQWAQAWVVLDRELERRQRGARPQDNTHDMPYRHTAYHAYLLDRCYKAMGAVLDAERQGRAWFDELIRARGPQLDRMLFAALHGTGASSVRGEGGDDPRLELTTEGQRTRVMTRDDRIPLGPALGYFLYRGNPKGGRAEGVWMIEALPRPAGAHGLEAQARAMRTRPYPSPEDGRRAYAYLPLSFNDGVYSLVPEH